MRCGHILYLSSRFIWSDLPCAVSIFPTEASCLRLITALLMETSEAWGTGRVYLSITDT